MRSPSLRGRSVLWLVVGALCSSGMMIGLGVRAGAAITPPRLAAFYGDSIMFESSHVVDGAFTHERGWSHKIRSFPGSAPCDWRAQLKSDLAHLHPTVVVLETMGNDLTTCMTRVTSDRGSRAYYDKYRSDFDAYFGEASKDGAKVLFVQPLPVPSKKFSGILEHLTAIARTEGAKFHDVSIASAPRDSVAMSNKFVMTKTCLPTETAAMGCTEATKKILVRAPDHLHLCPTGYPTLYSFFIGCSVYSSGAVRYGSALTKSAINPPNPIRR